MKPVYSTNAGKRISAYVLMKYNEKAGLIHVHHGEGRTYCDVFLSGIESGYAQGIASGYGYDKCNTCIANALNKVYKTEYFDQNNWSKNLIDNYGIIVLQAI